jgi:ribulose-5-phosphate 4-epimerase/fuculose-1-phosphate aldolase
MAKTCVHHKETPAATMCHQCHAPICTACSIVTPHGTFCSPECGILFRDFKDRRSAEKEDQAYSKMTVVIKLVAALLLIGLGFVGINQAAEHGMPQLRRIDVIGRILDLFKPH